MDLTTTDFSQLQEKWQYLNEEKKLLVLQIIDNFMPQYDDWDDDELSENDLHHIRLGEQELANGETASWNDIAWKKPD